MLAGLFVGHLYDKGTPFLLVLKIHELGALAPLPFRVPFLWRCTGSPSFGGSLELTGDKERDKQAGTVAGLHCLQSHVATHTSDRRDLSTVVSAGEGAWRSFLCSWPHLYLVLSQLKEIGRYEAVMLFSQVYPFIRCTEQ